MIDRALIKEITMGMGLGLLTNLIWAIASDQINIYLIILIFIAAFIVYYLIWRLVVKPLNISRHSGIIGHYSSYDDAKTVLKSALKESSNIKIMSVGGSSITEEDRGELLDLLAKRALAGAQIKILLLNPDSNEAKARYLELNRLKPINHKLEDFRHHIVGSTYKIVSRNPNLKVRYYSTKPVWRLYIFEKIAYVSFYLGEKEGHETNMLVLERGCDLFSGIERQFDAMWDIDEQLNTQTSVVD